MGGRSALRKRHEQLRCGGTNKHDRFQSAYNSCSGTSAPDGTRRRRNVDDDDDDDALPNKLEERRAAPDMHRDQVRSLEAQTPDQRNDGSLRPSRRSRRGKRGDVRGSGTCTDPPDPTVRLLHSSITAHEVQRSAAPMPARRRRIKGWISPAAGGLGTPAVASPSASNRRPCAAGPRATRGAWHSGPCFPFFFCFLAFLWMLIPPPWTQTQRCRRISDGDRGRADPRSVRR
jgi:hypothetical protein